MPLRGTYRDRSVARELLPERLTMIGVPGQMVLVHPHTGDFYVWRPKANHILCASGDGREMFLLRALGDAGKPHRLDQVVAVQRLWERFTHRASDGYYNFFVQPFQRPHLRGLIQTIRYRVEKDDGELYGDGLEGEVEYEHPFEAPDYARLYHVGHDQFYIPRGKWRISSAGIGHYNARQERQSA